MKKVLFHTSEAAPFGAFCGHLCQFDPVLLLKFNCLKMLSFKFWKCKAISLNSAAPEARYVFFFMLSFREEKVIYHW